tara:strand:+ start:7049 stop:7273 length:225 start_codon:yes stop_codon:yes gene_type:complete
MKKTLIYEWIYNISLHHNGRNIALSTALAKKYTNKVIYDYAITQYNDLNLKYLFEQDMIKSLRNKNASEITKIK